MLKRAWCCWLSTWIVLGCLSGAEAADRVRILRVRHERVPSAPAREPAPVELRLDKFLNAPAPDAGAERFLVEWQPVGRALESGAVLRFEYRQERVRNVQQLFIRYPFAVDTRRQATFEIAPAAARAGGTVTGWRVRLEQDGRVLAEHASSTWNRGSR